MRSLRIAQVVPVYPPYRGGMAQIGREYTERLRRRGHLVDVFTTRHGSVSDDPPFVRRLFGVGFGNAAVVPSLLFRLQPYDLVHLHYPYFGGAEFALVRRALTPKQPLVLTYQMDAAAGGLKGLIFDMHRRMILPPTVRLADRILVSSLDYVASSALASLRECSKRMEVHPFGVDLLRFHPGEDHQLRMSLGATPGETVLIFVGTLDDAHHFKGLALLLEALAGLKRTGWRLVIVGDGPLRPVYEQLATARQIHSQVVFAGNVPDEALPRYYRSADIHLFPSTGRSEAYGLVVTEAAASGVPSIVSSLPGVRTLVHVGQTGWHIPPGNPTVLGATIEQALNHPEQRRECGRQARLLAQRLLAWDPLIDKLERTYEQLLRNR